MPDFMNNWWEALNFELQLFYGIAIISLAVLAIQVLLALVFGMDDGADAGGMDVGDHDSGMGIFSIRGVTAFFTGFGWTGVICTKQGLGLPLTLLLALMVGGSLMVAIYLMMRSLIRLQSSGTLDYGNAVGQMGTVYLTIPPVQRSGGQVETMIQGRLVTAEALQKGRAPLQPGTKVKVVERIGSTTLIVEPLD
jgi:membrane protein implicated in regulation of membrane protease activity